MVTDEERDYMYAEYAKDPRMKLNLGIRRRLAPLLDNGRDEIELMTAILFSLPGSPILYYGDEIGMGDNVYLGDRDGVRTPMQWTGDRNGGFSRADFAQLYAPPLMDPVYGFQAVNVEAQLRTPTSLLRWMRRFIALRKEHPVFGLGTYEPLTPENTRIFAHVRRYEDDIVLCVHNLARSAQAVELDLLRVRGPVPEEMFGRTRSRASASCPTCSRSAPRGFFWFRLIDGRRDRRKAPDTATRHRRRDSRSLDEERVGSSASRPALVRRRSRASVTRGRACSTASLLARRAAAAACCALRRGPLRDRDARALPAAARRCRRRRASAAAQDAIAATPTAGSVYDALGRPRARGARSCG